MRAKRFLLVTVLILLVFAIVYFAYIDPVLLEPGRESMREFLTQQEPAIRTQIALTPRP